MDNVISLNNLFNGRVFRVPDYQRGYSWGERQIREFLQDLELLDAGSGRNHYTGTIALHQPRVPSHEKLMDSEGGVYSPVDVVDGQQRMTTIVLLLDGICRILDDLSDEAKELSKGIRKNYIASPKTKEQLLYKLTLNTDTNNYFQNNVIAYKLAVEGAQNTSQRRLGVAKEQIAKYLAANVEKQGTAGEEWVKALYAKVATQLRFTLYEVEEEAEVGVIFEVMNDRGKPLTDLEKVKNFLLHASTILDNGGNLAKTVNGTWAEILRQLMAANLTLPDHEDQLLQVHWLSHYNPNRKAWNRTRGIKAEFHLQRPKEQRPALLDQLFLYTKSLRDSCFSFCDAHTPQRPGAFGSFKEMDGGAWEDVVVWSEKLRRLNTLATFLPLLLATRERWPDEPRKYLEVVKLCEKYSFRVYSLKESRSDSGESTLFHLGHDVARAIETFEGAIRRLKEDIAYRCGDATFEKLTSADADKVRNAYGRRGLRYFLYEYESELASNKGVAPKVQWAEVQNELKDTIEHILPQTIEGQDYWTARFGEHGKEQHMQNLHDLGNLTLSKWNAHYQNKPFPNKKGTQGTGTEYCYAKAPFFSEQELTKWDDWTPSDIEERRTQLLEWARERWKVDFSNLVAESPGDEPPDDELEEDAGILDDDGEV